MDLREKICRIRREGVAVYSALLMSLAGNNFLESELESQLIETLKRSVLIICKMRGSCKYLCTVGESDPRVPS